MAFTHSGLDIAGTSLIGSTSGVISSPTPISTSETWLGNAATNLGTASKDHTIIIGQSTGVNATNSFYSIFIGDQAGNGADTAANSIFIGKQAGNGSSGADTSIFLGNFAGAGVTNAAVCNFFGQVSGYQATGAYGSNFIGSATGYRATNAFHSIFIGDGTGDTATDASGSIFIGKDAGKSDTVNNTASLEIYSILLGNYINTGGFSNSILIGGGTVVVPASNTKANQFMLSDNITDVRWAGVEYTLPTTLGNAGSSLVDTVGDGVLSWKNNMSYGSLEITFDAIETTFNIPHGMSSIPSSFALTFSDGRNTDFIQSDRTVDATNIIITCDTPPGVGTIIVYWQAFK